MYALRFTAVGFWAATNIVMVLDEAVAWARELAGGAVVAQGLAKAAIDEGLEGSLDSGLHREQELFVEVFTTDDARIGVDSFKENGPGHARFTGR